VLHAAMLARPHPGGQASAQTRNRHRKQPPGFLLCRSATPRLTAPLSHCGTASSRVKPQRHPAIGPAKSRARLPLRFCRARAAFAPKPTPNGADFPPRTSSMLPRALLSRFCRKPTLVP
jgi:hypothetical protein